MATAGRAGGGGPGDLSGTQGSSGGSLPLFVGFNDEATRMVTAGSHGFSLFQVPPPGSFQLLRTEESLGPISIVALMHCVPLVAVVPAATNRVLQLFDLKEKQSVSEIQFDAAIVNVLLNTSRLVVVLEHHVHLFDLNTLNAVAQIRCTPPNKRGVAALTGLLDNGTCYLAFPHSATPEGRGEVFVVDALRNHQIAAIPAHKSPVACIAFDGTGTCIATCSDKGTVIRVFTATSPHLICTFRRGTNAATIYHLAFSPSGEILTATSNSGTLHIFRRGDGKQSSEVRAFRKVNVRKTPTICGINPNDSTLTVVTLPVPGEHSGLVAQYTMDSDQVNLVKEFQLGQ
jgi:WD40 repeat protein